MNHENQSFSRKIYKISGILIFLACAGIIICSPNQPVYDEIYFYNNTIEVIEQGWSIKYLLTYEHQAPGPLYQLCFWGMHQLGVPTNIVIMRFITFIFFLATAIISVKSITILVDQKISQLEESFSPLAIPFLYPLFCMALTEMFSMFFLSVAIYLFIRYTKKNGIILLLLSALCYSLATLGRQHFLIIFPAFILHFLMVEWDSKGKLVKEILSFSVISLLPIGLLISLWKGLVPPAQHFASGESLFSISVENGILGIAYFAIMFYLLFPEIIFLHLKRKMMISYALVGALIVQLILRIEYLPLLTVFEKLGLDFSILYYLTPGIFIFLSIFWAGNLFSDLYKRSRKEHWWIIAINLLLAVSPFKTIHNFSSRYIAQSSHILLLISPELSIKKNYYVRIVLLILGGTLGLNSVYTYYFG